MNAIDYFLDRITMYRLILYYLIFLIGIAVFLGFLGLISIQPLPLLLSTGFLLAVAWITNKVFAFVFSAPTNVESVYISALILALIVSPGSSFHSIPFLFWMAVWSMASKYIFAIKKKHIFNPVAIAAVLTSWGLSQYAIWWIGTAWMMPFVLVGGLLIVRKIRRPDLVFSFFVSSLMVTVGVTLFQGGNAVSVLQKVLLQSSFFFFAFVMLTEPLTTPPTKSLQMLYGALVGILFSPQFHLGTLTFTPELALVVGNIFSYLVSPKQKLVLRLVKKVQLAADLYDFYFQPKNNLKFVPGQYMEWTLSHPQTDSRGNRRYFTLASSPTEDTLRLGVKFYNNSSSYKKSLLALDEKDEIVASQLAGDFVLPKDPQQKIVFMAGGIGITPFRSMLKYLVDTKQKRQIVLLYANKRIDEIIYTDVLSAASQQLGVKTVFTLTDTAVIPPDWKGRKGRVTQQMIQEEVPDYKEYTFYLSGPQTMVNGFTHVLTQMGIPTTQIKTDFFPGFA